MLSRCEDVKLGLRRSKSVGLCRPKYAKVDLMRSIEG